MVVALQVDTDSVFQVPNFKSGSAPSLSVEY
jgi:hypothetical protein